MSSESNAAKWLVGCLIAGVVGVLLCGGAGALLVFWGMGAAKQIAQVEIQDQVQEVSFAEQWRPPAEDADAETLFPKAIGGWALVGHDEAAVISELAMVQDGHHGTYESAGTKVDVYVYQVPSGDQTQAFDEALHAIDQAGYSTSTNQDMDLGAVHRLRFSFSPPERHGRMWWAKDRLVVTMTDNGGVNLQSFEREYVLAIQGPLVSEIEEPAIPAQSPDVAEPEPLPGEAATDEADQTDAPPESSGATAADPEAESAPADPQAE